LGEIVGRQKTLPSLLCMSTSVSDRLEILLPNPIGNPVHILVAADRWRLQGGSGEIPTDITFVFSQLLRSPAFVAFVFRLSVISCMVSVRDVAQHSYIVSKIQI